MNSDHLIYLMLNQIVKFKSLLYVLIIFILKNKFINTYFLFLIKDRKTQPVAKFMLGSG